jgi:hypothetical protein
VIAIALHHPVDTILAMAGRDVIGASLPAVRVCDHLRSRMTRAGSPRFARAPDDLARRAGQPAARPDPQWHMILIS